MDDFYSLVRPYEGNRDFIFISYSHADKPVVFPLLKKLYENGYRFWYDEGIDPGSEWPESIANHLSTSRVVIAFLSNNSINSKYCKREIHYALSQDKEFLSVALEPVEMSAGLEMQISSYQSLLKYKYPTEESFEEKLLSLDILKCCKEIIVHEVNDEVLSDLTPEDREVMANKEKEDPAVIDNESPTKTEPAKEKEDSLKEVALKSQEKKEPRKEKKESKQLTKEKDNTPKKGLFKLLKRIGLGVLAICLALGVYAAVKGMTTAKLVIDGKTYVNDGNYLSFYSKSIKPEHTRILGRFDKLTNLSFEDCEFSDDCLDYLTELVSLRNISFENCTGVTLSFLKNYSELGTIKVIHCGLTDDSIKDISFPEKIEKIDLSNNEITFVPKLNEIKYFVMDNNKIATTFNLIDYSGLTECSLMHNQISSLGSISMCQTIKILNIDYNLIPSVSTLSGAENLTELTISNNKVSDISSLASCTKLTKLDISDNLISDVSPLGNCTKLAQLDISNNKITDINGLEPCVYLKGVYLSENNISDASALRHCTLETVSLWRTKVKDFSFLDNSLGTMKALYLVDMDKVDTDRLSKMTKLETLWICNCNITDLSFAKNMTNLRILNAAKNKIEDLSGISKCGKLNIINLMFNRISSLNGLPSEKNNISALLLNNNKIASINDLPKQSIDLLTIYDNPITQPMTVEKINGRYIITDMLDTIDPGKLTSFLGGVYISEKNLDLQVSWEKALGDRIKYISRKDAWNRIFELIDYEGSFTVYLN